MYRTTDELSPKDRPFDPAKIPRTDSMRRVVSEVLDRITCAEARVRRRQAVAQRIHEEAVSALVCDLTHRALSEPSGWLAVELSNAELSPKKRRAPFMTEQFRDLVKTLAAPEIAVADLQLGHRTSFRGVRSTIKAGAWLTKRIDDLGLLFGDMGRNRESLPDPLLLRSIKTKRKAITLPLPETTQVHQLRSEMWEINNWLAEADVAWNSCEVTDRVDVGQRHLRRIFNDGSLEYGGRLYFGFWQDLGKAVRLEHLRIDGGPIASLDFAQMSVRLAYAKAGVEPPEGDLYQVHGLGSSPRQGVKEVMNALLASPKVPTRMPKGARQHFPQRVKIADVIEAVGRRHPALKPQFGTAQGLVHQNTESRVIVRALLQLKSLGVTALPIHDCLLVNQDFADITQQVLEEAFAEVTGVKGKVEVELPHPSITTGFTSAPLK